MDQGLIYFFLIGVVIFIAYKALIKIPGPLPGFRKKQSERRGPVAEMQYLVEMSQKGIYSREKMIRYLRNSIVHIMALQRKMPETDIKKGIETGSIQIPFEIRPIFDEGPENKIYPKTEKRQGVFKKKDTLPMINFESVLRYLENEMDIKDYGLKG